MQGGVDNAASDKAGVQGGGDDVASNEVVYLDVNLRRSCDKLMEKLESRVYFCSWVTELKQDEVPGGAGFACTGLYVVVRH